MSKLLRNLDYFFRYGFENITVYAAKTSADVSNLYTSIRMFLHLNERPVGAQRLTVNRLAVGSIPTRGDEIFT